MKLDIIILISSLQTLKNKIKKLKKLLLCFKIKRLSKKKTIPTIFVHVIKQSQQKKTSNTSRILEQLMLKLIVKIFFVSDKFSRTQITVSLYVSAPTTSNIYTVATQSAANIMNRKKKVNSRCQREREDENRQYLELIKRCLRTIILQRKERSVQECWKRMTCDLQYLYWLFLLF